ncbi:NADPH-dependent FMN reductase [Pelomonas sp. KK5]|uniref:NADPH-dependent FMN reductase n=1 Tax=Pelomonas sp. KK5 TaxID=1855730 RepID=UPI00097C40F6|nr:NADPH-dependent FMN reductase [Pelomonas sp. KK5]
MRLLAISGSLRAASINSALLRAVGRLAPAQVDVRLCALVGALPIFNPDLDCEGALPPPVARLRDEIAAADALLIASPEYAHGVSGAIKNTLDWLVSFEGFVDKPVAVLNSSPRAHHADDALRETLLTMSARIIGPASIPISLLGSGIKTEEQILASADATAAIGQVFVALREALA